MFHATASQRQLASLVSNNCICNHIHYTTNVVQHNAIQVFEPMNVFLAFLVQKLWPKN